MKDTHVYLEIDAEPLQRWVPVNLHPLRDCEPGTAEAFSLDESEPFTKSRARVWRWRGHAKWSWSATDAAGVYHEDRPEAADARLFDTAEQAKRHALIVAGIIDDGVTSGCRQKTKADL